MTSGSAQLKSLIRLADRKDILKGSLNPLQEDALSWLMIEEIERETDIERERMKYTILAANPKMYRFLYEEKDEDEDVEWITPESAEDLEAIENILAGVPQESGESFIVPSE